MMNTGIWLTLLVVFAAGAYGKDCSDERVAEVESKCQLELNRVATDNFTADCINGKLQDHTDCLLEISECTELMGNVEIGLAEQYGADSVILQSVTGTGGQSKKGCRVVCGVQCRCCPFRCGFDCGLRCSWRFGKREAESSSDYECKIDFRGTRDLGTGGSVAFRPVAILSVLSVITAVIFV